jgi:hypothetical protein
MFAGYLILYYNSIYREGAFARDSTAAMLIAISLFILPKTIPNVFCWSSGDGRFFFNWPFFLKLNKYYIYILCYKLSMAMSCAHIR